ncbi:hypothetical protein [Tabrizicola sp.]|uniref:hypothetical protein n=1 Tax=Tabrizicola sp. TaxID=2005166 RepID=UPI00273663B6|nr:hypothetical protein [Tabrizicola sp.]MDP3194513.1 hypothetical protein [Tabrizicola sp.]
MPRINTILAATVAAFTLTGVPALAETVKGCPPGLAKKDPACIPPGQVGKSWTPDRIYVEGDRIRGDYVVIPADDWDDFSLTPYGDGTVYVVIDNQIVRVRESNLVVVEPIRILENVLN